MWRLSLIFASLLLAQLPLAASAIAEKRIALVIGIDKYKNLSDLNNPVADAGALAELLRTHGFTVLEHHDLKRGEFLDALEAFQEKASDADLAVIYYAGHGMEIAGRNILAPSDLIVECQPKRARRAVRLEKLFETIEDVPKQLVLLDACRNDPFPQCKTKAGRGGAGFRGLSRLGAGANSLLIANATLSQSLASDGPPGQHSPFAKSLLHRLQTRPTEFFRELLDGVAKDVMSATNHEQIPEIVSRGGLPRTCLKGGSACGGPAGKEAPSDTQPLPPIVSNPCDRLYAETKDSSNETSALEKFLARCPSHANAEDARRRQDQLVKGRCDRLYQRSLSSQDKRKSLEAFLDRCRTHARAERARELLSELTDAENCQLCLTRKTISACEFYKRAHANGMCVERVRTLLDKLYGNDDGELVARRDAEPFDTEPKTRPPVEPVPPVAPTRSFTVYRGYDLYGGDYGRLPGKVSYSQCHSACRDDERCSAFTYNTKARACFLKASVPNRKPFKHAISGVLSSRSQPGLAVSTVDPPAPIGSCGGGFTTYDNSDFLGNDLGGYVASLAGCRSLCRQRRRCVGFSWIKTSVKKRCWIKYALSRPRTNYGVVSCRRNR